MVLPLDGVRVLDFSRFLSGPYCTSVLADMGAEVTKVERYPDGDDARRLEPKVNGASYPFATANRNKRSICLDLKSDEGRRVFLRIANYAKYGAEILRQPGALAYQLFDAKTGHLLRQDEYTAPGVSRHEASTIVELADKIGINPQSLERTVEEYNAAVQPGEFNPAVKDGKRTEGIEPPKSNWALPLDAPPFLAFAVTCGITFTFGGLHIDSKSRVLNTEGIPIPGLHAAGELVGGLFYHNYPGGSGLTAGSDFGRRAGKSAAEHAAFQQGVRRG